MSTDIVSIEVLLCFIPVMTEFYGGAIVTLVDVLVDVLDGPHIEGEFHIDVTLKFEKEEGRVGNHPSVVHRMALDLMTYASVVTTVFWISIFSNCGLIAKVFRKVFSAPVVLHAG